MIQVLEGDMPVCPHCHMPFYDDVADGLTCRCEHCGCSSIVMVRRSIRFITLAIPPVALSVNDSGQIRAIYG